MIRVALLFAGLLFLAVPLSAQDVSATPGSPQAGVSADMVEAAEALLATMDDQAQRQQMLGISKEEKLLLSLEDETRRDWSYWPRPRAGLSLELMTAEQRTLTHDLLSSLLSAKGHLKVVQIMELEEVLGALEEGGLPRAVEDYFLVFFGTPSVTAPWAWRFEGHHVSLSVTVVSGGVTVTPSFLGANPAEIRNGALAGFRVLRAEEDLGRQLVLSLDAAQRARAVVSGDAPRDIFSGNLRKERSDWDTWRTALRPEGIAVSDLNESQRILVQRIIDEVITTYRPEVSTVYLQGIDLHDLSFAWMGSLERRSPHYYRLQGGDFVFEFDNSQNGGNHIHTVWRSPTRDFGDDLLVPLIFDFFKKSLVIWGHRGLERCAVRTASPSRGSRRLFSST